MSKKFTTPLKRVHVAAARIPQAKPCVSANAFKLILTAQIQSHQGLATEAIVITDEEGGINQNHSSDVSASKSRKRSHTDLHSSSPVAHSFHTSLPVAPLKKKAKSHSAGLHSSLPVSRFFHSSSPVPRSSSPVVPLQKKVNVRKCSHAEIRSSSPVDHSLRSFRVTWFVKWLGSSGIGLIGWLLRWILKRSLLRRCCKAQKSQFIFSLQLLLKI